MILPGGKILRVVFPQTGDWISQGILDVDG